PRGRRREPEISARPIVAPSNQSFEQVQAAITCQPAETRGERREGTERERSEAAVHRKRYRQPHEKVKGQRYGRNQVVLLPYQRSRNEPDQGSRQPQPP